MGNNTSTYDRVPSIAQTSLPSHGFHVLCVVSGSNASLAGVEAFFDYVVSVDGKLTSKDDELLLATRAGLSNKLDLVLFSSKSRRLREVTLESHPEKGFGFTVRQCVLPLEDRVWHILDVLPNSPAEHAGLRPVTDYIVGLAEYESDAPIVLTSRDSLFEAVEAHIGAVIPLVVYSTVLDSLRRVDLAPRFDWGGPGCMGCDIGYGPLHRIPDPHRHSHDHSENHGHDHGVEHEHGGHEHGGHEHGGHGENHEHGHGENHQHEHDQHHEHEHGHGQARQEIQNTILSSSNALPNSGSLNGPKPVMRIISKLSGPSVVENHPHSHSHGDGVHGNNEEVGHTGHSSLHNHDHREHLDGPGEVGVGDGAKESSHEQHNGCSHSHDEPLVEHNHAGNSGGRGNHDQEAKHENLLESRRYGLGKPKFEKKVGLVGKGREHGHSHSGGGSCGDEHSH